MSITTPPPRLDIHVTRGDIFEMPIGLVDVPEVVANPNQFQFRMGFRVRQDDNLPFIVWKLATVEISPDDTFNGTPLDVILTFRFEPADTQLLPRQGGFYLVEQTDIIGGSNKRLFQGRVKTGD